jgi:NAD(P)-dependent dehydrogenase (short-subunit alcohol dehydrogenase family)
MMKTLGLGGKKVIATGAGGFLGSYICNALRYEGVKVLGLDLGEEKSVPTNTGAYIIKNLDITDKEQFGLIKEYVCENFFDSGSGYIDGIVNNAAVSFKGNRTSSKEFSRTLEINVEGTYNCITQFEDLLTPDASIINVASTYGILSPDFRIYNGNEDLYNSSSYGASKAAIIQMTKYYAAQMAPVRVNAVSPGGIFQNHDRGFEKQYSDRVPLGRMANPEEIADAILFLLSPMSSYITGHNLIVDGGLSVW